MRERSDREPGLSKRGGDGERGAKRRRDAGVATPGLSHRLRGR